MNGKNVGFCRAECTLSFRIPGTSLCQVCGFWVWFGELAQVWCHVTASCETGLVTQLLLAFKVEGSFTSITVHGLLAFPVDADMDRTHIISLPLHSSWSSICWDGFYLWSVSLLFLAWLNLHFWKESQKNSFFINVLFETCTEPDWSKRESLKWLKKFLYFSYFKIGPACTVTK